MRGAIVALDLETTGLNPATDTIIEIGAVRAQDGQIIDTYRELINPERPIPPRVTAITGIRAEDVANALRLPEVLPALKRFVGDAPIVGHNINFDLDFLRHNGLPFSNPVIDTYELASALLPTAPRYNLNALMQLLNLTVEGDYHSALTDSKATIMVYHSLWQKLLKDVPISVLREIVRAGSALDWLGKPALEAALRERQTEADQSPTMASLNFAVPNAPTQARPESISEWDNVIEFAVYESFKTGEPLIADVPPDARSRRAMLAASVRNAHDTQGRVIVASANADRQAHLQMHELPAIQAALKLAQPVAILKRREHYLCLRRVETLRRRAPTSIQELRILAKILIWAAQGASGEQDDVTLRGPDEYAAWNRLSAADENCLLQRCEVQTGGICPFYRAQQAAEAAPLVFVTHGLLLADGTGDDSPLPHADYVLIDEAHRLED